MLSNCDEISTLVKKVKKIKLQDRADVLEGAALTELILKKWAMMKSLYRKKLKRYRSDFLTEYFKQEAEEQIVLGLLSLLNEKLINYILSSKE